MQLLFAEPSDQHATGQGLSIIEQSHDERSSRTEETPSSPVQAKALDRGGIVNLIGRFRRAVDDHPDMARVTVVQNRAIMQRVEDDGLHEPGVVGLNRLEQLDRLAGVMAEVLPMTAEQIGDELQKF